MPIGAGARPPIKKIVPRPAPANESAAPVAAEQGAKNVSSETTSTPVSGVEEKAGGGDETTASETPESTPAQATGGGPGKDKQLKQKWGKELIDVGYTVIPNIIIQKQKQLGLDPIDINIILHLCCYWWKPHDLPYPGKKKIAEAMGIDESTVRKRIKKLEDANLVRRKYRKHPEFGQQTSEYDIAGLISAAKPYAVEALQVREQRKAEDVTRQKRMRARVTVKKDDTE